MTCVGFEPRTKYKEDKTSSAKLHMTFWHIFNTIYIYIYSFNTVQMQTDTKIGSKQYHIQKNIRIWYHSYADRCENGLKTVSYTENIRIWYHFMQADAKKGLKTVSYTENKPKYPIRIQKSKTITNKDKNVLTINIYILTFLTQIHTDYYMFTYLLHPNNTEKIINAKNIQKNQKNKFKNGLKGLRNLRNRKLTCYRHLECS